jgi:hypothetical protein
MNITPDNEEYFSYEWKTFPTYGYLVLKPPKKYMDIIKDAIKNVRENKSKAAVHNKELVGQIAEEYLFDKEISEKLKPFLLGVATEYEKIFGKHYEFSSPKTSIDGMDAVAWVNLQKKHEYNPMHKHKGFYSFAIWVEIPYNLKKERQYANSIKSDYRTNSNFAFVYTNSLGEIIAHQINVSKESEETMVFFPAQMSHYVNPFYTSDDERVSVAGNLI